MARTRLQEKQEKEREARLPIVANLYLNCYTLRQIAKEVSSILKMPTYSLSTAKRDVDLLLTEWREKRQNDTAAAIDLAFARIDRETRELWVQWEASKQTNGIGNPSFMSEIHKRNIERNKLWNLYDSKEAPNKEPQPIIIETTPRGAEALQKIMQNAAADKGHAATPPPIIRTN